MTEGKLNLDNSEDTNKDAIFDQIIDDIGSFGRYQKQYVFLFNFIFGVFLSILFTNNIFPLAVSDHWCHVPGRESTNFTLEEWKLRTIPREIDNLKELKFSSCFMYNITDGFQFLPPNDTSELNELNVDKIPCQHGWDYDRSWFLETAPSAENWVCDNKIYAANGLALSRVGDIIGTVIFGQLGDKFGRKIIFFVSVSILVFGRSVVVFTSFNHILFGIVTVIGSLTVISAWTSKMIIGMEICPGKYRATIIMVQCLAWTAASVLMPMLMWLVGDWKVFLLITSLPPLLLFFSYKFMVESPRLLLTQGRADDCLKQLTKIAKVNKKNLPIDIKGRLSKISDTSGKFYGILGCFSNWRLTIMTSILIYIGCCTNVSYFVVVYNSVRMKGNPFTNYMWQAIAELPGYVIGQVLCDRIGRRFTGIVAYFGCFLSSLSVIFIMSFQLTSYVPYVTAVIKFFISLCYYVMDLVILELYPTCIRQSSNGFFAVVSSLAGTLAPYIVHMGAAADERIPFSIIAICLFFCVIVIFFLPETLNKALPETLEEAQIFGLNQKYFSLNKSPDDKCKYTTTALNDF